MANHTLNNIILQMRNAPASEWVTKNSVLSKGELGFEIDTRKFKIGDGTTGWNSLPYAGGSVEVKTTAPTTTNTEYEIGTFWINSSNNKIYLLVAKSTSAVWINLAQSTDILNEAVTAQKLKTARTIALAGDATGSASFDGSANATITVVLANSGVAAGTYTKLTVNAKGVVTSATQITAADIPNLTLAKITDAGTAASKNVGTSSGNVPILGSDGKLDANVLPALAITDTHVVATQAAMLALTAQVGDVAVRTDLNKSYILRVAPATTLANWQELLSPPNAVLSVNSKTGAVVLTTSDIAEGTRLYYTDARVNTRIAASSVRSMSDGAKVLMSDDTLILNGGGA